MLRLATIRTGSDTNTTTNITNTRCVRIDDGEQHAGGVTGIAVETGHVDIGELLAQPNWRTLAAGASGPRHDLAELPDTAFAPLVTRPDKVICVGLNYRDHIAEMGNQVPEFPTLFPKFARTLTGAYDPIVLPPESAKVDWEAELTIVIGAEVRRARGADAAAAIAGYTVANDVSMRDFQRNTSQFLAGKVWEATTPVGPWLVVTDHPSDVPEFDIECRIGDEVMQSSNTGQLLFDPVTLVEYISTMITLTPGDLILTGTPGGVGNGRTPERYLQPGEVVTTTIATIGTCRNTFIR